MKSLTIKDLKDFIKDIPIEFDGSEISWVDFSGYSNLCITIYDDGAIIRDGMSKFTDKRGTSWY